MKRILPSILLSLSSVAMAVEQSYVDYRQGNFEKALPQLLKQKNDKVALYYLGQMTLNGYASPKSTPKGLNYIKQSASRGYMPAQLYLAKLALKENKPKEAFKWFKWAANTGNIEASMYVASAYLHGYGVTRNPDKARKYIVYTAKKGQAASQAELAKNFLKSKRYRSKKLGKIWLRKALKQDNSQAMVLQAKRYLSGRTAFREPDKAQKLLMQAADKGNIQAFYELGKFHEKSGEYTGYDEAYTWYQKATDQGNADAMYRLGALKLTSDPQQAMHYLKKSAKLGNKSSMRKLAEIYRQGKYVQADKALAKSWYRKSKKRYSKKVVNAKSATFAWLGDGNEKQILAMFLMNTADSDWHNKQALKQGILNASPQLPVINKQQVFSPDFSITKPADVDLYAVINTLTKLSPKDTQFKTAFPHYNLDLKHTDISTFEWQAHHGDSIAQFKLGLAYQYGVGVSKDPMQARTWYIKAVKQKNVRAEYQLGLMYLMGDGLDQNFEKAMYWMNKSAFKGNAMSQFVLAVIYDNGYTSADGMHTIAADEEVAVNMYNLAASEGVAKAQLKLAQLYSKLLANNIYPVAKQKQMHKMIHEMYYFAYASDMKQAALPLAYYTVAKKDASDKDLNWAYDIAKKLANKGDAQASLLLGLINDKGLASRKNEAQAVFWYQDAVKQQNPVAYFMLGTHYYTGNGVSKNIDKSLKLLGQASSYGLAYADYNMAIIKQHQGQSFIEDLTKAADKHYAKAELTLADYYLLQGSDPAMLARAADSYQRLAEFGYDSAQLKLAYLYQHGIVLPQNNKQAALWYKHAARQGEPVAQFSIAKMYQTGTGGKQNLTKAKYWYEKAAKQQFSPAMTALGFYNEVFKRDYLAAENWYYQAAHKGEPIAEYDLGIMYLQGKGLRVENEKAVKWLTQAANENNAQAQTILGLLYLNGQYVTKSPDKAYQWFVKAARQDNKQAYYQLGLLYETGVGTKLDEKRALIHYQQAAELGNAKAKYALGRLYDYGLGMSEDKSKAANYYQQAVKNNVAAQFRLAMLYLDGVGVEKNQAKAKALFKKAASNGSFRAQDYYNYLAKFKLENYKAQLNSYVDSIPLKFTLIERESSPNLLYLNAITDLNQGELIQSRKMLNQIMSTFPDFNPAKKVLKNI